ncbi:MAG: competence/damage-inducible protein A [Rhizobiaceae bacterium]|nr:competence/damage-inducible protein A [Rhizobiaceae bacterium]
MSEIITAAILAIGDELLSGRTKDKNIGYLANFLTLKGIDLKEARIVSDDEDAIVKAVNELRSEYDYVFTSGGIGPTHDDITADAIAKAFGVGIHHDPRAMAILEPHYAARGMEFTDARKRMARLPIGSELIDNPVSKAPGFQIGNVYVMAGVPAIFQAMVDALAPGLKSGVKLLSKAIDCPFGEGTIGDGLASIQKAHPETAIGSYPRFDGKTYSTQILVRSRDEDAANAAIKAIAELFEELKS